MAAGHGTTMEMMSGQAGMPSLPDRLERAEAHISAQLETLRAMKGPTTQLYAVLSDEQKRMADRLADGHDGNDVGDGISARPHAGLPLAGFGVGGTCVSLCQPS